MQKLSNTLRLASRASIHSFIIALLLATISPTASALRSGERRELLDAIRPEVTRKAGQSVRFKIDKLNHVGEWAVIVGGLLAQEGKPMDWSKAKGCDPVLDKILWVVARKEADGWSAKEIDICSPEPPYWYLVPKVAFSRPCGLYAGLQMDSGSTAEEQCKAYLAKRGGQLR